MKNTYKVLTTNNDFLVAALSQSKMSVWYREDEDPIGHLMDYGGIVGGIHQPLLNSLELILFGGGFNSEQK